MISFSKWLESRSVQDKSLDWMDTKVKDKSIDKSGRLLKKSSGSEYELKAQPKAKKSPPSKPPFLTSSDNESEPCKCKCFPCTVLKSCKSCNCKNCKCEGCKCGLKNKNSNSNKYKKNYK